MARKSKTFLPDTIYYNPYRPPGKSPEGYKWSVVSRHETKGYVIDWKLIPSVTTFELRQGEGPDFPTFAGRSGEGEELEDSRLRDAGKELKS